VLAAAGKIGIDYDYDYELLMNPCGFTTWLKNKANWRADRPARRAAPLQSGVKPPQSKFFSEHEHEKNRHNHL
jgi:hypothetical protein